MMGKALQQYTKPTRPKGTELIAIHGGVEVRCYWPPENEEPQFFFRIFNQPAISGRGFSPAHLEAFTEIIAQIQKELKEES